MPDKNREQMETQVIESLELTIQTLSHPKSADEYVEIWVLCGIHEAAHMLIGRNEKWPARSNRVVTINLRSSINCSEHSASWLRICKKPLGSHTSAPWSVSIELDGTLNNGDKIKLVRSTPERVIGGDSPNEFTSHFSSLETAH